MASQRGRESLPTFELVLRGPNVFIRARLKKRLALVILAVTILVLFALINGYPPAVDALLNLLHAK